MEGGVLRFLRAKGFKGHGRRGDDNVDGRVARAAIVSQDWGLECAGYRKHLAHSAYEWGIYLYPDISLFAS